MTLFLSCAAALVSFIALLLAVYTAGCHCGFYKGYSAAAGNKCRNKDCDFSPTYNETVFHIDDTPKEQE